MDWNNESKRGFVDNFFVQMVNGWMNIQLKLGKDRENYILPPEVAKQLGKALTREIARVENQLGIVFDDRLDDEPMASPLNSKKD